MAGDPEFTHLLLAMGLRSLSMHPSQIASIKQRVLRTDARRWSAQLERVLTSDDPEHECKNVAQTLSPPQRALAVSAE